MTKNTFLKQSGKCDVSRFTIQHQFNQEMRLYNADHSIVPILHSGHRTNDDSLKHQNSFTYLRYNFFKC